MTTLKQTALVLLSLVAVPVASLDARAEEDAAPALSPAANRALDREWAEKRMIRTIQKKENRKDSRHEFTIFAGVTPNNEFFTYLPLGLRYDYFFTEDIALEIWGEYMVSFKTGLEQYLEEQSSNQLLLDVPQTLEWMAGVTGVWSPIHGKMGVADGALGHFDVHLAFGAGVIGTQVLSEEQRESSRVVNVSGHLGLGFRFWLTDFVTMRLEYRQFFYPEDDAVPGAGLAHPSEFTLGISFFTEAPE